MISILHFSNTEARGGVEEHILSLLRGLDRKHFRPYLACTAKVASQLRSDIPEDVELFPLELTGPTSIGAAFGLAHILLKRRIDILHSHMFQSSLFASPIGKLCGVPAIVETPHIREHWRRGWFKGSYLVDRCVGRTVDHYIAVSAANADYLIAQKGLPAEKIVVIQSGSNVSRFDPARRAPEGLKQGLGFAETDPVIVVVARLEPQKGHKVLLEAMPAILHEVPNAKLVCLSDGSLRVELQQRARELALEHSVRFVGYQPDVRDWLALADLTVLPSFFEGLPLAAIESLAAGKPIIATAVDGTPEVVLNGKTGLTVPPGDSAALAESICRLLRDPRLRMEMGQAGRQWVVDHFSEELLVHRTQDSYLRLWEKYLNRRGHRGVPNATHEEVRRTATGRS